MFYNIFLLFLVAMIVIIAFLRDSIIVRDFDRESSLSLKGILSICVVIRHLFGRCFQIPDMIPLGYYSVILFFFCAGYGLMFQFAFQGPKYLINFFEERWLKVFIPFCIATLVYGGFYNLLFCKIFFGGGKCISLLELLNGEPILPFSWFAVTILIYYIAFYMCAKLCRKTGLLLVILMLCFTFQYIYIIGIKLAWGGYWINAILAINVGMFWQIFEREIKIVIASHHRICAVFLLCIMSLFLLISSDGFWIKSLVCCLCIPIITIFFIYYLGMINNTVTKCLGKYSYEIYLTHGTVLVLYSLFDNTFTNQCYFTIFATISIAILSLILKKVSFKIKKIII